MASVLKGSDGAQANRVVAAYVSADLANALEEQARREERSVSQVIRRALRTAMSDAGTAQR